MISLFHAQGNIWPELGEPIPEVPTVYEFACYCDFPKPPQIRIEGTAKMLEGKLDAISAYASQDQIELVVAINATSDQSNISTSWGSTFTAPSNTTCCLAGDCPTFRLSENWDRPL